MTEGTGGAGDVFVNVGADLSQLDSALNTAVSEVATAGQKMADAFGAVDFGSLNSGMSTAATEAKVLDDAMLKLADSTKQAGGGLHDSTQGWMNLQPAMKDTASAAKEADAGFADAFMTMAGGLVTLAALKAALFGVVEAFGAVEKAGLALGAIVGNADDAAKAIERAKKLADELGVAQDQLIKSQQRMVAIGVQLKDVPRVMEAIADGAAAMNMSFQTVNSRFDQIIDSGALMVRGLVSMGLQIEDVAKVMGMAGASTKDVQAAFHSLADAQDRATVLSSALLQKYSDLAVKSASETEGAWTRIKNSVETAMQDIGKALDGMKGLTQVVSLAFKTLETGALAVIVILKELANGVAAFNMLVGNAVGALAKALWDVVHGDFAKANQELLDANKRGAAYWTSFLESVKTDWTDTSKAMDKVWADTGKSVRDTSDRMTPAFDNVNKSLVKLNENWQTSAQRALDSLKAMQSGEKDAAGVVTQLQGVIETASLHWDKLSEKSRATFEKLVDGLNAAKAAEVEAINNQALDQLAVKVHNIEIAASEMADKVPKDFADMMAGIARGENFSGLQRQLETTIQKLKDDLKTIGPELAGGMQIAIDKAGEALGRITDMNEALKLIGQDKSMDVLAGQITGLVHELDKGDISAAQFNQGMLNVGAALEKTVIPAMQKGIPVTQQLLDALRSAGPVGAQFADAISKGVDAASNAFTAFAEKARASALSVDGAIKDLGGQSMDSLRTTMTRFGDDIVKAFSNIQSSVAMATGEFRNNELIALDWASKVWPAIRAGIPVADDVVAAIAKIAPALAAAANQGVDAFTRAWDALKKKVDATKKSLEDTFHVFTEGLNGIREFNAILAPNTLIIGNMQDGYSQRLVNFTPPTAPVGGGSTSGGSSGAPASPTASAPVTYSLIDLMNQQLASQQALVAIDQKQLDAVIAQFNLGKVTKDAVDAAMAQLKAAQDAAIATSNAIANTTNSLNSTTGVLATTTSTLQDTAAGLAAVGAGLTAGLSTTASALQTVAAVTAIGTAAMLAGIKQVITAIAPIVAGPSPQWSRVSLAQLGIQLAGAPAGAAGLGGSLTPGGPPLIGSLTVNAPSNDPRVLASQIIKELNAAGLRT